MKQLTLIAFLVFSLGAVVCAQPETSPAVRSRRGLGQLDLLSMSRTVATESGAPVGVDLETFELLVPLIRHCRELENDYNAIIADVDKQESFEQFYDTIGLKALAIPRSILLIKNTKTLSPEAVALVDKSRVLGMDAARAAAAIRYGEDPRFTTDERFVKELAQLFEQYGIGASADHPGDRKALLSAILRRLNANFARIKIQS